MLRVDHLSVSFDSGRSQRVDALQDMSFDLAAQQTLGIVGESGSGKSTLARAIMQLVPICQGQIEWCGKNIKFFDRAGLRNFRQQVQLIFQDPLDALDPRMTVAEILAEPLRYLRAGLGRQEIARRVEEILAATGLSRDYLQRYAHEFSGGQCQRIGIARAMIVRPRLLICDEPVSALDVSIQAQIVNLLAELREADGLSLIFISHDLSVVRHISERVLVLYSGRIMELADAETLYQNPLHPYTQSLLEAVPLADPRQERQRIKKYGMRREANSLNPVAERGCVFYSRCSAAEEQCRQQVPRLKKVKDGHLAACHRLV